MNILICGDSFAANWDGNYPGWVDLLAEKYNVTNIAQAGISEYKILKQVQSIDPTDYDYIFVSHTSPFRVHTREHPIHKKGLHKDCDLIYKDVIERFAWFNPSLKAAQNWFKYHFDKEYQIGMYLLVRKEIRKLLGSSKYISITHTDISKEYIVEHNNVDFSDIWKQHKGKVNHYTQQGNEIVYKKLLDIIK